MICATPDCGRSLYCKAVCSRCYQRAYRFLPEQVEKRKAQVREYYLRHREKSLADHKAWRAKNLEKHREMIRRHGKEHVLEKRAASAKRRAQLLHATPPWVDEVALEQVYTDCPPGMHVDHIVPLQGKDVSGLHVPWNLQYLTPSENFRKSNKVLK